MCGAYLTRLMRETCPHGRLSYSLKFTAADRAFSQVFVATAVWAHLQSVWPSSPRCPLSLSTSGGTEIRARRMRSVDQLTSRDETHHPTHARLAAHPERYSGRMESNAAATCPGAGPVHGARSPGQGPCSRLEPCVRRARQGQVSSYTCTHHALTTRYYNGGTYLYRN